MRILELNNNILQVQVDTLKLLKQHYESYWLDFSLKYSESEINCHVSKARLMTYHVREDKADDILRKLDEENKELGEELARVNERVERFKGLDQNLVAEYRKLKDDLECQEMLIQMSAGNISTNNANTTITHGPVGFT